ncbi:MAG: S1 RNA-binding domain-containing protein [Fusobacteriaceae bacterium]
MSVNEYNNEFEELLNEYLPPDENAKVRIKAKISQLDRNYVYLDSDGQPTAIRVKAEELQDYKIGDEVEIILFGETDDGEFLIGSRRKIEMEESGLALDQSFETKAVLTCKIIRKVNGGYILEYKKMQGFLPNSLSEIAAKNSDSAVGTMIDVVVKEIKQEKKGRRVTFSKKDITLEKVGEEFKGVSVGDVVEGDIVEVLDFGINLKVGNLRGFVHISEVSWKKIDSLKASYNIGDKLTCKVISLDEEKKSLKLSLKALTKDPWEQAAESIKVDAEVEGKVTNIVQYGVFVEIMDGVEGLVHVSDFTWNKKKINLNDFVKVGDKVKVRVLDFDRATRKLKLGVKQLSENPWDSVERDYPVGTKLTGKVLDIKPFGIFVEVCEGIEVFIHQLDLSWSKEEKPKLEVGDSVDFIIIEVNKEENKIKGSIKNLTPSPWEKALEIYKVGQVIEAAEIKTIMDFGVFIKLEKGVDGFVPAQFLSKETNKSLKDKFSVGQTLRAEIVEIDNDRQRIKLSVKKLELDETKAEEKELLEKYSESSSDGAKDTESENNE